MPFEIFWTIGFVGIIVAIATFARSVTVKTTQDSETVKGILHFGGFVVSVWLFIGLLGISITHEEPRQPIAPIEVKK